ncbi:MAG: 3-deoxy-8-phosphooctulonate synthase [Proteobacteria bacterium]|jgi:2-dehydro-3-deoxyphosphooctonate aldolase (KDO 8-P synthase)|nr:3-deoxy-8-phosphooctulonate synthase [Pseudomonadota bacterium]
MGTDQQVTIGKIKISNRLPMTLIAGPCAIESKDHALDMASALAEMTAKLGMGFIYKSSFDKANRTSLHSPRGLGIDQGLAVLAEVKKTIGCPVLTDVHLPDHCAEVGEVVDVLQIPAFLCRQTDLLIAAANTGQVVNVKKGQFLAPWDMRHVVNKLAEAGNPRIMITERGTSFGYNTLVTDMRSLPQLAETGYPVIFDATHSVQQPGGLGGASGGQREYVPTLARAAVAVGVAGVFMETHQDPDNALSDGPNMVPLDQMLGLLKRLFELDALTKSAVS